MNRISAICWISITVCSLVFCYILLAAPETGIFSDAANRDESIREIKDSQDVHYLQQRTVGIITLSSNAGSNAMLLCRISLAVLFVAIACSSAILYQVRKHSRNDSVGRTSSFH